MTKGELNQLNDIREEISELEKKITTLQQMQIDAVQDKVKASQQNYPYIQGSAIVTGYDAVTELRKDKILREKQKLLIARKEKAELLELKITAYINSIDDSKIRRIIQYRYIEGCTWKKISKLMHCDRTYPEKILTKYLNEHI